MESITNHHNQRFNTSQVIQHHGLELYTEQPVGTAVLGQAIPLPLQTSNP